MVQDLKKRNNKYQYLGKNKQKYVTCVYSNIKTGTYYFFIKNIFWHVYIYINYQLNVFT